MPALHKALPAVEASQRDPDDAPEVVAVRDFILRERPVFAMDYHSPDVPTIGNKIWWPWYDPTTYQYGPDDDIYHPICQTLGIQNSGNRPPLENLKDFVRDKSLLLVLDNFEQILAGYRRRSPQQALDL